MHDVYFGSTYLYGVTTVEENTERDVTVYDGLQSGKFPVAENRELKSWAIECQLTEERETYHDSQWREASRIFKRLDRALNDKAPERLIISAGYGKTSKRALLTGYTKTEVYKGVYDVVMQFMEHVSVSVRTSNVPYVPRPGKVPEPPKTVVLNGEDITPYSMQMKYGMGAATESVGVGRYQVLNDSHPILGPPSPLVFSDPATAKQYYNTTIIPSYKQIKVKKEEFFQSRFEQFNEKKERPQYAGGTAQPKGVLQAISDGYEKFKERVNRR